MSTSRIVKFQTLPRYRRLLIDCCRTPRSVFGRVEEKAKAYREMCKSSLEAGLLLLDAEKSQLRSYRMTNRPRSLARGKQKSDSLALICYAYQVLRRKGMMKEVAQSAQSRIGHSSAGFQAEARRRTRVSNAAITPMKSPAWTLSLGSLQLILWLRSYSSAYDRDMRRNNRGSRRRTARGPTALFLQTFAQQVTNKKKCPAH